MGLEHLSTVFNDISENLGKPPADKHNQRPPASVDPPHIPEFYQPQREDPISTKSTFLKLNKLIKIDTIDEMQDPSPLMPKDKTIDFESKIVGPYPNSLVKRTIDPNPIFSNEEEVNFRENQLSFEFGKNMKLGEGKLIFDTLYKHSHSANTNRIQIDTGRTDYDGKSIKINTGPAGLINLSNLDIKSHSSWWRTGNFPGPGPEPYQITNIPEELPSLSGVGNNRDLIPFKASLDDVSRLAKFYTSPAGLAFMAKENVTNVTIGDGLKITEPRGFTMAPPAPITNTGFLNFVQQSVQGARFGSIRRPFKIQYSTKASEGLPFANLGDRPNKIFQTVLDSALSDDYPPQLPGIPSKELDTSKIRATMEIMEEAQTPLIGRPTPFIDLSKGPKETDYIDRVSLQPVISTKSDDTIAPEEKGDFYVRIKDLRNKTFIYFRGYVTGITENVNPSFAPINYIGRSEPVYLYQRAERDLSFNLRVYPANNAEFTNMYDKIEKLTSLAYPEYLPELDKSHQSMVRMKAPFTELYMAHIGSRVRGQFGFIKSITYTVNETGDWDALQSLPRLFDIAISYQILNKKSPSLGDKFYRLKPEGKGPDILDINLPGIPS